MTNLYDIKETIREAIVFQQLRVILPEKVGITDIREAVRFLMKRDPLIFKNITRFRFDKNTHYLYIDYNSLAESDALIPTQNINQEKKKKSNRFEGVGAAFFGIVGGMSAPSNNIINSFHTIFTKGENNSGSTFYSLQSSHNIFKRKEATWLLNASVYAPFKVIKNKLFLIRVFVHLPEESTAIDNLVGEIDEKAIKKANKTLDLYVKLKDKISASLILDPDIKIDEPIKSGIWHGRFLEFDYPCKITERDIDSIWGKVMISINNVPAGELQFIIEADDSTQQPLYAKMDIKRYSKIFISYAHADYSQVKGIAEGCKINGTEYFFDRHSLRAGDLFKEKILKYIEDADLFVLCWSENAAKSKWVQIERQHALSLIRQGKCGLTIYPLSMPPEAPLPEDMIDKYNFAKL